MLNIDSCKPVSCQALNDTIPSTWHKQPWKCYTGYYKDSLANDDVEDPVSVPGQQAVHHLLCIWPGLTSLLRLLQGLSLHHLNDNNSHVKWNNDRKNCLYLFSSHTPVHQALHLRHLGRKINYTFCVFWEESIEVSFSFSITKMYNRLKYAPSLSWCKCLHQYYHN